MAQLVGAARRWRALPENVGSAAPYFIGRPLSACRRPLSIGIFGWHARRPPALLQASSSSNRESISGGPGVSGVGITCIPCSDHVCMEAGNRWGKRGAMGGKDRRYMGDVREASIFPYNLCLLLFPILVVVVVRSGGAVLMPHLGKFSFRAAIGRIKKRKERKRTRFISSCARRRCRLLLFGHVNHALRPSGFWNLAAQQTPPRRDGLRKSARFLLFFPPFFASPGSRTT